MVEAKLIDEEGGESLDEYLDKYRDDPDYTGTRVQQLRRETMTDFNNLPALLNEGGKFYDLKLANNASGMKGVMAQERTLRLRSNLAVMGMAEKILTLAKYVAMRPPELEKTNTITERSMQKLEDLTDMLSRYSRQIEESSLQLDEYQMQILDEMLHADEMYHEAADRQRAYRGQLAEHKEQLVKTRRFSPEFVECFKNCVAGNRHYFNAVRDCTLNLKRRDVRSAELTEVNQVSNYANTMSLHLAMLAEHTGLLAEHLSQVYNTLRYVSDASRDSMDVDKGFRKAINLVSSYKGLVSRIINLKKGDMMRMMSRESKALYSGR